MKNMFYGASKFNKDISMKSVTVADSPTGSAYTAWNVSNVTDMIQCFIVLWILIRY